MKEIDEITGEIVDAAYELHTRLAPAFNMPSTKNQETLTENVTLNDYRGKWLILFFYPLDFTSVCPTEIKAFSDRITETPVCCACESNRFSSAARKALAVA